MKRRILILTLITLGLLYVLPASAQQTGTISGTVHDPSGAVIPKAEVTVSNLATGFKRSGVANQEGFFNFVQLPVGTYVLTATAPGFKTATNSDIELHVAEDKTVPISLEIGATSDIVTVTGGATEVNLRSGEVSNLIGSQQVSELPLNGRSFVQLTLLVPGASVGDNANSKFTGLLGGVDISMSGAPANANAWLVDGADNVDHGSGRTILVYPSVDSIEEFKVQRNSYGAENNAAGGAQINLVTKGGTNLFHGSVYEFWRNDILNANNFFLNRANQPMAKLRYNNFGYTFNGPIIKDKLFFFWSEEWRREVRGVTRKATVPTDLERQGNFSGPHSANQPTPVDPFTGKPFPNNTIPGSQQSPAGVAILGLLPKANVPGALVDNWVSAVPVGIFTRQEQIRGDYNINAKNQIMARYTQDTWTNPAPNYGAEGGLWGDTGYPTVDSSWAQPGKNFAARWTSTLSPTAINSVQFSYSNNRIFITEGLGANISADINSKLPTVFPHANDPHHSTFWAAAPVNSLWNIAPWDNLSDIYSWKDDFTKTISNHSLKFGGQFTYTKKDEDNAYDNKPSFWGPVGGGAGMGGGWGDPKAPGDGSGGVTGNVLADLLYKGAYWAGGDEGSNATRSIIGWRDIEVYFADTWRVKPRFTLDYGVRWSMLPPSYQRDFKMGNFVPALWDPKVGTSDPLNGMIFPTGLVMAANGIKGGDANLKGLNVDGTALRNGGLNTLAPRLGFAWDPTGAGKWSIRMGSGMFFGRPDMSMPTGGMSGNPPFRSTLTWPNGRPLDSIPSPLPTAGVGSPGEAISLDWKVQGSYQWNFTIEREIMKDTKIEVAYVGNRGHHLPMNYDLNGVHPENWLNYARMQYDPAGGNSQRDPLYRPWYALKGTGTLQYITQSANSSYHSAQVFITKRFSNNFSYQFAYTFSKMLADMGMSCCGGGDNAKLVSQQAAWYDYGLADFDRTNVATFNIIYKMPTFANKGRAASMIIGDWEITSIYQYTSGVPLTPTTGGTTGLWRNRPDLVGDPNAGTPTVDRWFNTNAYVVPTFGKLGTSGKGYVRAPAINNMDLAIYKNFKITERTKLQFRFETFNTLNHTQLRNIDTGFQMPTNLAADLTKNQWVLPSQCSSWAGCQNNANFGRAQNVRDPREIQIALKLLF